MELTLSRSWMLRTTYQVLRGKTSVVFAKKSSHREQCAEGIFKQFILEIKNRTAIFARKCSRINHH